MPDRPTILALTPTQRDPNRTSIRVGQPGRKGRVVATLGRRQMAELDLHVGQPWGDDLATRVGAAAVFDKALRQAMNRLGRRAMSRSGVQRKLRDLGYDPAVQQRVLERLDELKLLDDEAFGKALVREAQRAKPAGPMLLRQKLMQKGVDRKLTDRIVDQATDDPQQQLDAALDLARKRLRSMGRLDAQARYRRLYGLLARRGFTPDTIREAMDTLKDQITAGDDADDAFE